MVTGGNNGTRWIAPEGCYDTTELYEDKAWRIILGKLPATLVIKFRVAKIDDRILLFGCRNTHYCVVGLWGLEWSLPKF